ncbi:type II toxin-antitoxin system RelE/ParE family toxin [Thiospirochaeta perfilievii]|uniref:Type II toxin-antitoxin system RelE/ParE family toxin n=1 Tax=Thiospirochaeta perfilievii TaxID=252967 RepID=A0A5C1Q9R9_9SPIO|nr:type II toxin-antitoxin system RelE/ParE family toxin [Thiospirochaeta perfilievii]QEN04088.1 type II toxin-antitoxin system RelE/ParE family toxin [Thiospirochaeta perfilievii]
MINKWNIIYYEQNQESEVFDFVESQKNSNKAKLLSWLSILEEKGPLLPRPYADILDDGIHELRIKLTGKQVRILYFFCFKDFIILTNCFNKKTNKVPKKEIAKAKMYRDDFLSKYNEEKLRKEYNENI